MIIGISGYSKINDNLFCNGYVQNVIFFCEFIEKHFSSSTIIPLNSPNWLDCNPHFDIILLFAPFTNEDSDKIKKKYPNCKNVFIKYGHEYYNDLLRLLPDGMNDVQHAPKGFNIDEVWISPHFEPTKHYYEAMYNNAKVKLAPFIWKPCNLCMKPFAKEDFNCDKNIYIIEPNINMSKTSLIPLLIVNELWKKYPNSFNKLYVVGNNNYRDNKYFSSTILPKIPVLHGIHNKTFFSPRQTLPELFNQPGILLSHQEDCGLNYIYLEALYLKLPWVHNSSFFKECGHYYEDKNIPQGVLALKNALDNFKPVNNDHIIKKYNPDNSQNVMMYKNMINSCVNSTVIPTIN